MKLRSILRFAVGISLLTASQAAAQSAPGINITASASVNARPNTARITINIEQRAQQAEQAASATEKSVKTIITALKKLAINPIEITTANFAMHPWQEYNRTTNKQVHKGFVVRNSIIVSITDIQGVGTVLDSALNHGATSIAPVEYSQSERSKYEVQALEVAVAKAKQLAEISAKAAGGTIGPLLGMTYSNRPSGPMPHQALASMESAQRVPTVLPGDITIRVDVSTQWEFNP